MWPVTQARKAGTSSAHRDNTTRRTSHRRFAVFLNLNADDFQGGDLQFPKFGQQPYKPPTSGAVEFLATREVRNSKMVGDRARWSITVSQLQLAD